MSKKSRARDAYITSVMREQPTLFPSRDRAAAAAKVEKKAAKAEKKAADGKAGGQ
jgi:hypothetical protein